MLRRPHGPGPPVRGSQGDRRCYLFQPLEQRIIADQGLLAYFFFDQDLSDLAYFSTDTTFTDFNFTWPDGTPDPAVIPAGDGFSARWTGNLEVSTTGTYGFSGSFSDGARLIIDGQTVFDSWPTLAGDTNGDGDSNGDGTVDLTDLNNVLDTFGKAWGQTHNAYGEITLDSSVSHSFELDFFNHPGDSGFLDLSMFTPQSGGGAPSTTPTPIAATDFTLPAPVVVGLMSTKGGVEGAPVAIQAYYGNPASSVPSVTVDWNDPGVANDTPTLTPTAAHTGTLSASHTYATSGTYLACSRSVGRPGRATTRSP